MRVRFSLEGGLAALPGLSGPFELDSRTLPEPEAVALRRGLEQNRFFELRDQVSTLPDARTYTISASDGSRSNTVRLSDPLPSSDLEDFVNLLRRLARAGH